ncbi:MAG: 4Fe-4S ferredoxin [candidate division Zixibacteria bacterium CG_4_9_14_3_um_filter_46_8]|nr:MAG: 4Fe-4S ferredoxin [candidate division Zixibacteria bacterium CG_4_9_14_3_um_filter_46_8]
MNISRRDLIKMAGVAGGILIGGDAKAENASFPPSTDDAPGVLMDTTICIGCRKCEWNCNQANKLSLEEMSVFEDKSVFKTHRRPTEKAFTTINVFENPENTEKPFYIKIQCMHCIKPACVSACIVGALQKSKEGPVTYDAAKCMGCRYCMVACPFQIPAYEYSDAFSPEVRKCGFCFDRITKEGKKPACVEICPNEALTFGKRKELVELAYSKIHQNPVRYFHHLYGEHEAGGTSWMYLSALDFAKTELPSLDSKPIPEFTEKIQHGIFKAFIPPIALYGLLGLIMYSFRASDDKEGERNDV